MMKGAQDQNLLLLNRYDYNKDLKNKTELDKYSKSSYLREDICKNPKYMQSMFVTSFIDYNEDEKKIIRENKNKQFYKYQRDIATIISCDYENEIDRTFYEAKKIKMPQCINTLNEINGINNTLIFPKNDTKIIINFDSDPNYKSLKDVYIELEDTDLYLNHIIVQSITNGKYSSEGETSFKNIKWTLRHIMKENEITKVFAYNCRFDYISLVTTERYLTKSKYRYFFPYGTEFHDILALSRYTLKGESEYRKFCEVNNYLTQRNANRYTAEIVAQYFFDKNFTEEHTALADCEIEYKILLKCRELGGANFETKMW
jgi:hypothetical protein